MVEDGKIFSMGPVFDSGNLEGCSELAATPTVDWGQGLGELLLVESSSSAGIARAEVASVKGSGWLILWRRFLIGWLSLRIRSSQRCGLSLGFIIGVSWSSWSWVQAPFCQERFVNLLGLGKFQGTGFLGDNGALVLRLQLGNKLCDESAGFLWVEITNLLWNIHKGSNDLVMTLLLSLLKSTSSTTDLNWKLLTGSISHKLAWLLLHILGATGRLIDSSALLWSLTIANLLHGLVALLHGLVVGLLLKGDRALLLKVLLTNLFLAWGELSDIGVVALLHILVSTLQDWLLLKTCHCLFLFHTAKTSFWVFLASTEVNASLDSAIVLSALSYSLVVRRMVTILVKSVVTHKVCSSSH